MISEDKLAVFLYILMRDHLPVGTVNTILKEQITSLENKEPDFSDKELETIARRTIQNLKVG